MTPVSEPSTHPTLLAKIACLDNESAWQRFVDGYKPFIADRCRLAGLNETDAEEVTQIVLVSLVRALPKFRYDPMKRFRGYLTCVVMNATRTYWKKRSQHLGSTDLGGTDALENFPDPAFAEPLASDVDDRVTVGLELLNRVIDCVQNRVEPHTWTAYWETAVQGRKPAEVAAQLNVSAATIYMAKTRVGQMIREEASRLIDPTP